MDGFVSNDVIIESELPIHFDTARLPACKQDGCINSLLSPTTITLTKNWAGVASGQE